MEKITIKDLKEQFKKTRLKDYKNLFLKYRHLSSKTAKKFLESKEKEYSNYLEKYNRYLSMIEFDKSYSSKLIAGIDEVGRGPIFGNVTAACVIIEANDELYEVYDSKTLGEKKRIELDALIRKYAIYVGVASISSKEIDEIGISRASINAMKKSLKAADNIDKAVIVDYVDLNKENIKSLSVTKADQKSFSVACASIVAKVHRDNMMMEIHEKLPYYSINKNKGYGTREHLDAIKKYGVSKYHRMTFLKNILKEKD